MKHNDRRALEFIAAMIGSTHGIFNAQILQGYYDQSWLYLVTAIAVFIYLYLFTFIKLDFFQIKIFGIVLLVIYGLLRLIYSLGMQLPGKGQDVFLPVVYSLAFGYVAATGAVACLIVYSYRFLRVKHGHKK